MVLLVIINLMEMETNASGNSNGLTNQGATPTIDRNGNANSAMSFNGSPI